MVEEGRDCLEISGQITVVRARANALNTEILEAFAPPEDAVEHAVPAIIGGSR